MVQNIIIFTLTIKMIFKLIFGNQIHVVKSNDKQKYIEFLKILPNVFKHLPKRYKLSYLDQDGDQITFQDQSDYQVLLTSGLKTAKINIREVSEEANQHINQVQIDKAQQEIIENQVSQIRQAKQPEQQASVLPMFEESVIEEKIKKIMPEIISKIKSEINEEMKQQKSNIFLKKQGREQKKEKQQKKQQGNLVIHEDITCDGCNQQGITGVRYKCSVCPDFDFCSKCQATKEHNHPFLKIKTLKQTPVKIFAVIQEQEIKKPWEQQKKQNSNEAPSFDKLVHKGFDIVKGYLNGQNQEQLREKCQVIKEEWKKKACSWKNAWTEENVKEEPKKQQKEQKSNASENKPKVQANSVFLKQNANYLVSLLGFNFEKALNLAQQFPSLSKQELLNYCLSQPELFE